MIGLQSLVKKFEFELEDERAPLFNILAQAFDILGGLINNHIMQENQISYEIIYLVSKIFYISNQLVVCPFLTENNAIDPWI